jgi:putative tricarboxylic transport membrane protein
MDLFASVQNGVFICLQPTNLAFCFLGVLIGTLVGVLPGLGPSAAIALLLPTTFHIPPVSAIIMLAGIYYGAMYGGSTTSILVSIPGEAASVITTLDGYQMARKGRAGAALGIAAFGSFIGGTLSIIGLMFLAPPMAEVALGFGPPENFAFLCLGLLLVASLGGGSFGKAIMMAVLGIFLGSIGRDVIAGTPRFCFGITDLMDGIGIVPLVMGLFGIAEVLFNLEESAKRVVVANRIEGLLPNGKDWKDSIGAILRGTGIGFFLGILPGGGSIIASFASYSIEKKISKEPEKFGTGIIQGVAAPETANNAATGGAFIPLLTLGIPCNAVMAVLVGAMMIYGIHPGPTLIREHSDLFWGVIISMYFGNIMLLILNLPLIRLWVKILKVPYPVLFPLILIFCLIGAFSINNNTFDVTLMVLFGFLGYFMRKFRYDAAPLIMAFVLGPLIEENLRHSLLLSKGSPIIFFTRPLAAVLILVNLFLITRSLCKNFLQRRRAKVIPKGAEITLEGG